MQTTRFRHVKTGNGRYGVYIGDQRLPVEIKGGKGKFMVFYKGHMWPTPRKLLRVAVSDVVSHHTGIGGRVFP